LNFAGEVESTEPRILFRTISLPVSSTIFNRILRQQVLSLDIPLLLKALVLSDPTKVQSVVPAEYRQIILDVLVYSIRKAFLFGIICSIVCAISFYFVPWAPLPSTPQRQQEGSTNIPDSPPKLPQISFAPEPDIENWRKLLSNSAWVISTPRGGTPVLFSGSSHEGSSRVVSWSGPTVKEYN
jgi:hypothetical protein